MVRKLVFDSWFVFRMAFYMKGCPRQTEDNASQYVYYFIPQEFYVIRVHGVDVSFPSIDFTA